ncbi:MAG TPA: Do family serine endopeptidase [Candidatus Acidoferrum sp.]|nr:Do family serine endopeptidase [Candidatus Acidoferrum sp.]
MTTKRAFWYGFSMACVAAGLFVATQQFTLNVRAADNSKKKVEEAKRERRELPQILVNTNALPKDTRGITSFAPVVKKVASSVVTIYSTKTVRQNLGMSPFDDPSFRRFFGFPDEGEDENAAPAPRRRSPRAPQSPGRQQKEQSLGSGVIVSADGYILSNNHVVEGADEVKVALSGSDEEFIAKVIGTDPQTDVSVLKIDAKNLQPVTMTDSDHLQVGDVVLAVGNPFGVGQTVTMGIVSAVGRGGFGIVDYEDFIQTDAAINRGNSGGALVDADGRLVGINTAIISPSGGSIGIGFSVPINMVRHVMNTIIQSGKVTRGYLGVLLAPEISSSLAQKFGLKDRSGALINDVGPNTPASKAGLQRGDIITEFNGRKVPDQRQLRLWVSQSSPNTKANLKVLRNGKAQNILATLGELPTEDLAGGPTSPGRPDAPKKSDALDGVEVGDLDARMRRQANIPNTIEGAIVTSVDPNSNAAEAGLRQGDIILELNKQKLKNADEAIELSEKAKGNESILLLVWTPGRGFSGGSTRYVVVEPEKK